MIEILRNQRLATQFQILAEIAGKGPFIQQRVIARELGITPQAVSDYISQLASEGLLIVEGRSNYRLTVEAVNWIIKSLVDINNYNNHVQKAINNIAVCAAVAGTDLDANQEVSLKMGKGQLIAFRGEGDGATGTTVNRASKGSDVGITAIRGIVPLSLGRVMVATVPGVEKGGSGNVDYERLELHLSNCFPVVALGLEASIALSRTGAGFQRFGAAEAAIEAAKSGLNPLVVCVDSHTSGLISQLAEARIGYQMIDASLAQPR